jgi:hypothetical protein
MHTPLGYVCQGRPLGNEHAFFMTNCAGDSSVAKSYHTSQGITGTQEDEDDDDEKWHDVQEGLTSIGSS